MDNFTDYCHLSLHVDRVGNGCTLESIVTTNWRTGHGYVESA